MKNKLIFSTKLIYFILRFFRRSLEFDKSVASDYSMLHLIIA